MTDSARKATRNDWVESVKGKTEGVGWGRGGGGEGGGDFYIPHLRHLTSENATDLDL